MAKLTLIILALAALAVGTQAAAIRNSTEVSGTTRSVATTESEVGTTEMMEGPVTTTSEVSLEGGALTKDEEASILVFGQTLMESSSADLVLVSSPNAQAEKSAKLLLLSTPKVGVRAKVPEESDEDSDEPEETPDTATESLLETPTTSGAEIEETTTIAAQEDAKMVEAMPTTKLFPINDTLYKGSDKNDTAVLSKDEPKEVMNANLAAVVLEEVESCDYVLVDTELVEEAPYADIDSDIRLQPIVQSVEIVPTSVDDSVLVNFVHQW